jgi:y4mF family transcriptional regulator
MWAQSPAEIGKIVVAGRRYRKLTQSQLARATGVTQTWISQIEQGKETAQIGKILRILSYLGVRLQVGAAPWPLLATRPSSKPTTELSAIISAHTGTKRAKSKS